jgi:virginiamycin B lyase
MRRTRCFVILLALSATFVWTSHIQARTAPSAAQTALTGQVTSQEEGPMEGVLVSAKKEGSNITITVVSDARGATTSRVREWNQDITF